MRGTEKLGGDKDLDARARGLNDLRDALEGGLAVLDEVTALPEGIAHLGGVALDQADAHGADLAGGVDLRPAEDRDADVGAGDADAVREPPGGFVGGVALHRAGAHGVDVGATGADTAELPGELA
eukprot:9382863-Alexandrium_andersonii.AAC.1